ncbi:MAG: PAS domain S-box protein [Acidobacteria bacterium]|nr:PAS domain S-box protein [Acidobacteriota bacterium]
MDTPEERLVAIFSTMAEGVVFQDASGRIDACNPSAERILGLTAAQMAGTTSMDPRWRAIHEDGSPFPGEDHPAMVTLRTGQPLSGVIMGVHKPDGTLTWISINSRAILRDARPLAVVTTFTDVTERQEAAIALRLSEERWKLAIEGARDGVWDRNCVTGEIFFSPRYKETLGYEEHEIGNSASEWESRVHPDDKPSVLATLNAHLEGKTPFYEAEYRMRCKDGSWKWIQGRGTVVSRGADGTPLRLVGAQTDITERKLAEQAREDAERQYREIFEGAMEGMYRTSPEGRSLAANSALARILGYESGEHAVASITDSASQAWLYPQDRTRFVQLLEDHGFVRDFECRLKRRDGSPVWVSLNSRKVCAQSGETLWYEGFIEDITERRLAETALRESEEKFRALFVNSPEALYLASLEDGTIDDINGAFEELFGHRREDVIGRSSSELNLYSDPADRQRVIAALRETGQIRGFEVQGRKKSGETLVASLSGTAMMLRGELHVLGVVRDITAGKVAEARLRESEEKFATVFRSNPTAMAISDPREGSRVIDVNDAFEKITGYRRDEAVGRTSVEKWFWLDRREHAQAVRLLAETGRLDDFEFHFRRKDGDIRTGLISARPIELGGRECVVSATVDLTAHKQADEALRQSEKRLEDIAFSAGDWIWEVDDACVYTYSSQRGLDWFGTGPGDVIGKRPFDFMPADEARKIKSIFAGIAAAKAPIKDLENWRIKKNGEKVCLLTNGVPVMDQAGNLKGYRGVDKDVTARKGAEEELKRLATAIEQAAETVMITDAAGTILYVNPAFEKTSGFSAAEALGNTPRLLRSGRHDAEFYRDMWAALTRGEVWRGTFQNKKKDGTLFEEDATISPVRDESGRITNFIAVKLDVTRESELQAQLTQAQKMESVGRLAGGIAHDFNNLLTVINGYSHLALTQLRTGDPLRAGLEEVHRAGLRAAALTGQLLAFSRKQILQPRVLNLNRVVEGMQSMLQRLVGEDVTVVFQPSPDLPTVNADPHQLEQVIMNLAVNAKDAMSRGGKLTIETGLVEWDESCARTNPDSRPGRYARLRVSDTGVGMDEATRQHIFEPFFTTKGPGKGTGLGLAMVQGIVAQSGGHLAVESAPGKGTTFTICLPALAAGGAEEAKQPSGRSLRGDETILVVEDEPDVCTFVVTVLEGCGYRVLSAAGPGEAVLICERHPRPIHMVLTDVVMPLMSGRELFARLEKLRPGLKALFMSGYTDDIVMRHGVREQGTHFLQKPFSPEALARKIREVLGPPVAGSGS